MKKIIFIYLFCINLLYGYSYNDLLLQVQSSVFPKIMLLDKSTQNKLINKKIFYTIVCDNSDYQKALEIKKYIDNTYKGYFDTYPYIIKIVTFSEISKKTPASVLYILKSSTKNIKKVAAIAQEKGIAAFSYDVNNLKKGLLFSLLIERSTVLYLNKKSLQLTKVDFVDSLFQMVKFID